MAVNAKRLFLLCFRVIAYLFSQGNTTEVDDVCAALALMYGYAASYAPSAAIEARIETLVVRNMSTELMMASRLTRDIFDFSTLPICFDLAWSLRL